jgi:hypothetical protein
MRSHPCPKSGRALQQSGEMEFAGHVVPVFQCDHCTIETEMFGEWVEVAVTFSVDAQGRIPNPADQSGPSLN